MSQLTYPLNLNPYRVQRPIITIKEARKILASEALNLSDEEIRTLLQNMEKLAEYGLKMSQDRKS